MSDVAGSLRHERTGDCDWSLERIDSSRFEHRMEGGLSVVAALG
jgi:hypothetical protein